MTSAIPEKNLGTAWMSRMMGALPCLLSETVPVGPISGVRCQRPSERPERPCPAGWLALLGLAAAASVVQFVWLVAAAILGAGLVRRRTKSSGVAQVGPYRLLEKIGEGGMGVVYKARHALLPRPVALKVLPSSRGSAQNRRRFEREARATSRLSHPNTISVHEFGSTDDGTLYYAMEYVDGVDLQTLVDVQGPQHPARVAHLLAQLCGALAEAHAFGLIHRDVKPANVVVAQREGTPDVVKVLDFGLVQDLAEPREQEPSEVRELVGTPLYLSPEAIASPERLDPRSDIYAVGAVGYFLLTGTPPFSGRGVLEVCAQHLHTRPTAPSKRRRSRVPAELEALVLSCLEKSPDARPADAASLRAALLPLAAPWLNGDGEPRRDVAC
jgi:eukaryotic-like serine/threonine-protein kinase